MDNFEDIKICSFNVNGLGDFKKRKDIFDFLRNHSANIFMLQETHIKVDCENLIRSQWGYDCIVAGRDTAKNGVAILFRNNFEYKLHSVFRDIDGRYVIVDITIMKKRISLVNVYAPSSGDHSEFFEELFREIVAMDNELMVIGGDWNLVLDPKIDSNQPSHVYRPRSRQKIIDFMFQYDLVDIFRTLYPEKRAYTWRRFNGTQRSRLDYFVTSKEMPP